MLKKVYKLSRDVRKLVTDASPVNAGDKVLVNETHCDLKKMKNQFVYCGKANRAAKSHKPAIQSAANVTFRNRLCTTLKLVYA